MQASHLLVLGQCAQKEVLGQSLKALRNRKQITVAKSGKSDKMKSC